VYGEGTYPFVFARAAGEEILLAIFNPGELAQNTRFTLNVGAKDFALLAGQEMTITCKNQDYTVEAPGVSYAIYRLK